MLRIQSVRLLLSRKKCTDVHRLWGSRKPRSCATCCQRAKNLESEVVVAANNVEAFWQRVFDELDELQELDRQQAIKTFVEYGRQHGIDVIEEVVDKGRSISEVFLTMAQSAKR